MRYIITLNSGVCTEVSKDDDRDITGLWVWMCRQYAPQFLNFNECTVKATDIAMIQVIED